MQTFLDIILKSEESYEQESSIYILPSRRSSNVLRTKIAATSKTTTFAPLIFSIEEFIEHVSGLTAADNIMLTFLLFKSYKEVVSKEKQVTFQVFCTWSQPILGDFNEIDRFLIDQHELFNHLTALKEITGHWTNSKTEIVLNYVDFWENLGAIYDLFCSKCNNLGAVHQGLIYRQSVNNIEHYLKSITDKRHVFIGFNALNTAEQELIQAILAAGNAEIYWDTEETFTNNLYHETSLFTATYKKTWDYFKSTPFKWSFNNYVEQKNITVYSTTQDIEQAKAVGAILSKKVQATLSKYDRDSLSRTAIILGDESLLLPILNALPHHINNVNITMGIPVLKTPTAAFFNQFFELKRNSQEKGYYHKDLVSLLHHPLSQLLLGNIAYKIEQHLTTNNIIYIKWQEIDAMFSQELADSCVHLFFKSWGNNVNQAIHNIQELIKRLKGRLKSASQHLQLEYLFGFYKAFNKLQNLITKYGYINDIPTLLYFYREVISSETIDLRGDQKQGLQIMGVLESRVLDYEHVIITSVNEGVLPAGKSNNSYIPYDLKQQYGLPTYSEKDAVYAYHFYHLLHRATTVDLCYTTNSSGLCSVEASRFIKQMELEGVHTINRVTIATSGTTTEKNTLIIKKSPEVISKLQQYFSKGISPSALTTYLRNPILFYERYVLGVRDNQEVEETVAATTMGIIVHETLEKIYEEFLNKQVTAEKLTAILPTIKKMVKAQFEISKGAHYIHQGKNKIIFEVVCNYITNYLRNEIALINKGDVVKIISLEATMHNVPLTGGVHLRGTVDLVENRNGTVRIIDYKTGKVSGTGLKLKNWEDLLLPEGKHEKAFQVLMYAYMIQKSDKLAIPFEIGVISFKNLKSGFLPFVFNKSSSVTQEVLQSFEEILNSLVTEILNPEIPFAERE